MNLSVKDVFNKLSDYCELEGYKGWDPYDGLNSKIFQSLPFRKNSLIRLAWIQLFKRNPLNLRKLLIIQKDYNPKALGLFLSGECQNYLREPSLKTTERIDFFINKLIELKSEGYSGACWGYNFDWQSRAFYQPKFTPTIVVTSYVANALLDAYEIFQDNTQLLELARSSCDFILSDLNRTVDLDGNFSFSYSPMDNTVVFNASLLGSRLLARVYNITKEDILFDAAQKSVKYCVNHQNSNGSWVYGTLQFHQWIDNFHTGFNLECLSDYVKYSGDDSVQLNIDQGLKYYLENFFTTEGISKYYNNKIYPVDIHAPAQLVIILSKLHLLDKNRELVDTVLNWTINNLWNKKGYFYYQKKRWIITKIPYMRWSQSWMYLSLSWYLKTVVKNGIKD